MKTWTQFLEAKQNEAILAPMNQPVTAGIRPTARRSATLNLNPAQQAAGVQAFQQARQPAPIGPAYGAPASDEEMGQQYAKSMQVQQAMAQQPSRRRV